MIRSLLQSLPKRQYLMTTRSHMKKTQPHEIAEMEEKESHDWGEVSKKDTSFERSNSMSNMLNSGEDYKKMSFNVEKDKWCS